MPIINDVELYPLWMKISAMEPFAALLCSVTGKSICKWKAINKITNAYAFNIVNFAKDCNITILDYIILRLKIYKFNKSHHF